MPERGARLARREAREYREYLSGEQRRQTGCPARQVGKRFRTRDTGAAARSPALVVVMIPLTLLHRRPLTLWRATPYREATYEQTRSAHPAATDARDVLRAGRPRRRPDARIRNP